jgi:toxin ParE1/3/4
MHMSYSRRILPAADADVDSAAEYIAQDNLDAALRFYDAVESTYRELRDNPKRWPVHELDHPRLTNIRKRAVIGFGNYLVFYRVEQPVVEIIRVLHGARDVPSILSES